MINDLTIIGLCFCYTVILEFLLALVFLRLRGKDLIIIILANILTNPLMNATFIYFKNKNFGIPFFDKYPKVYPVLLLIVLEIIVFIIEGIIFDKCIKKKKNSGYIISYVLNSFTLIVGLFLNILNVW